MEIFFARPTYLYFLFLIPIIILFHFLSLYLHRKRALTFANFEAIARVKGIDLYSKNLVNLVITILIIISLVCALAGPNTTRQVSTSTSSFVIAVDVSRSMEANDIPPSRIDRARSSAIEFVESLPSGTKSGVISFSGNSYIHQDLTTDRALVKQALSSLEISEIGGTDIYEAIITATNILDREDYKVVILLSDGQSNVGSLGDAIEYARKSSVIVYTIGLGTETGGETFFGLSKIDEDSLKAIAYETRGQYYRVQNSEDLDKSFKSIVTLGERSVNYDLTYWFVMAALVLIVISYVVITPRYLPFP
ncbi:VWA domain-containing protein [Candidatus Pacearchaeota archaeon]|nr:VWA domain-containing protein [Candidatus Pacearchaeota archaeon]